MKRFLTAAALVFFLILSLFSSFRQTRTGGNTAASLTRVERRDIQVQVDVLGALHAVKAHLIASQIRGAEAKIIYLAPDGYPVAQGDVLVRFDPVPFEAAVAALSTQSDTDKAGLEAARQLLEWEKADAAQQITAAEYELKVAQLELDRLVQGEGPMNLASLEEEHDKAVQELKRLQDYMADLEKLEKEGFHNPAELGRARDTIGMHQEKVASTSRRVASFRDFVLPSMSESARAKLENSQLRLQQSRQAGVHKVAKAGAAVRQVEASLVATNKQLEAARLELDKTVLTAPFSGLCIHYETYRNGELRTAREGDSVIVNQPIVFLPEISSLVVKAKVREMDLHKIATGQTAIIRVDAYPESAFAGHLTFIGSLAEKQPGNSGEKFFQIHLALAAGDDRLRPGMSARATIQATRKTNVLSLSLQSVFHDNQGPLVYRLEDGRLRQVMVQTGISDGTFIEISSGLEEGDLVSLLAPRET